LPILAPQVAPRNVKVTAVSLHCVSLSYDSVLYPNGPQSELVYQVNQLNNYDKWLAFQLNKFLWNHVIVSYKYIHKEIMN